MLSDVTTLSSLVQQAPALAVAVCALLFAAWTYKAARRSTREAEARQSVSNVRQGRRIGRLEKQVTLLDMRRRITEQELAQRGIHLSYWPPDSARPDPSDDENDEDEDTALDTSHLETQYFKPPPPASTRRTS